MQATHETTEAHCGNADDHEYDSYLSRLNAMFLADFADGSRRLFTTDATGLFDAYLAGFDESDRQYHNCHACRKFIETYGSLVTITETGETVSAVWPHGSPPAQYAASVSAMFRLVRRSKVTGVFLSADKTWGNPVTGEWKHFALTAPNWAYIANTKIKTASQAMAEKREEYGMVHRALSEQPIDVARQALAMLKSGHMPRAEKVAGAAEWFLKLHESLLSAHGARRANIVWRAIATAPAGYCHPRSSILGTILDDIAAGKSFDDIKRSYGAKMDPLQYQRPQAAPTAGNIAQGEKLIAELGLAPSLERRFARLDEVQAFWKPEHAKESAPSSGVFGHLKPKNTGSIPAIELPVTTMTWEKFMRTVLPDAISIRAHLPHIGNYCAILTALHPDSPPLFQYDHELLRNQFSDYLYNSGSQRTQWGLTESTANVVAIAHRPPHWFGSRFSHISNGAMLILEGARDSRKNQGNGLFPEILRAELREVRSTIEAYSQRATIHGYEDASACGLLIQASDSRINTKLTVTKRDGTTAEVMIDRLD